MFCWAFEEIWVLIKLIWNSITVIFLCLSAWSPGPSWTSRASRTPRIPWGRGHSRGPATRVQRNDQRWGPAIPVMDISYHHQGAIMKMGWTFWEIQWWSVLKCIQWCVYLWSAWTEATERRAAVDRPNEPSQLPTALITLESMTSYRRIEEAFHCKLKGPVVVDKKTLAELQNFQTVSADSIYTWLIS